jgi:hypothetical protein
MHLTLHILFLQLRFNALSSDSFAGMRCPARVGSVQTYLQSVRGIEAMP